MRQLIKFILAGGILTSMVIATPAHAVKVFDQCDANKESKVCQATKTDTSATSMVKTIINLLLFVLGITAVLMIIWGGVKYTTSRGDPTNVKSAKDTITYAVIGLIVAMLAFAIVNFIITSFR